MIELVIPGRGRYQLYHLVMDVEGTLSLDGRFYDELLRPIQSLRDRLHIHLITVDTFHQQDWIDRRLGLKAVRIQPTMPDRDEASQKAALVTRLGAEGVVAIGQGADDAQMLKAAALGICVLSPEGTAVETLLAADIVVSSVSDALALITSPMRILSTLRR